MVQGHHCYYTIIVKYISWLSKADAKVQNKSHFLPVEAIKPCFYDSTGMFLQSITHYKLLKINDLQRAGGVSGRRPLAEAGATLKNFLL